jgi:hypothetical protein
MDGCVGFGLARQTFVPIVEQQEVAGKIWAHGDGGIYVLNRVCLGAS